MFDLKARICAVVLATFVSSGPAFSQENPNLLLGEAITLYSEAMDATGQERKELFAEVDGILTRIQTNHPDSIPATFMKNGTPLGPIDVELIAAELKDPFEGLPRETTRAIERVAAIACQQTDCADEVKTAMAEFFLENVFLSGGSELANATDIEKVRWLFSNPGRFESNIDRVNAFGELMDNEAFIKGLDERIGDAVRPKVRKELATDAVKDLGRDIAIFLVTSAATEVTADWLEGRGMIDEALLARTLIEPSVDIGTLLATAKVATMTSAGVGAVVIWAKNAYALVELGQKSIQAEETGATKEQQLQVLADAIYSLQTSLGTGVVTGPMFSEEDQGVIVTPQMAAAFEASLQKSYERQQYWLSSNDAVLLASFDNIIELAKTAARTFNTVTGAVANVVEGLSDEFGQSTATLPADLQGSQVATDGFLGPYVGAVDGFDEVIGTTYSGWGPSIVPPSGADLGYRPCGDRRDIRRCLEEKGVSKEAIDFSFAVSGDMVGEVFAVDFQETGEIDVAQVQFNGASPHRWPVLLNGSVKELKVEATRNLAAVFTDPTSRNMLRQFPQASSRTAEIRSHRLLSDGTQRFALVETIIDGCRACPILGSAVTFLEIGPSTGGTLRRRPIGLSLEDPKDSVDLSARVLRERPDSLQTMLNILGYNAGEMDGLPGPQTRMALMTFQAERCLPTTGQPDNATIRAILTTDGYDAACSGKKIPDGISANAPLFAGKYVKDLEQCKLEQTPWELLWEQVLVNGTNILLGHENPCTTRRTDIRDGITLFRGSCSWADNTQNASWRLDVRSNSEFSFITQQNTFGNLESAIYRLCKESYDAQVEVAYLEPERGAALRKSILDAVRPVAEIHFGSPVEFIVDKMRVLERQAYVELSAQRPNGVKIDLASTPAAKRGEVDFGVGNINVISGFLTQQSGEWKPRDLVIQATEAWWVENCNGLEELMPETCGQSGTPENTDLAALPTSLPEVTDKGVDVPEGWNKAKEIMSRNIVRDYAGLENLPTIADVAEYSVLAWDSYGGSDAFAAVRNLGWTPLRNYAGKRYVAGDAIANLYTGPDGKIALAFRGTVTGRDWITNTAGTLSPAPFLKGQIQDALEIARTVANEHANVVFVGHSLGGRLAQVSAMATGRQAYVFNSAPVGSRDVDSEGIEFSSDQLHFFRSPQDPLSSIFGNNDIEVSNVQKWDVKSLSELVGLVGHKHSIQVLAQAMLDVRQAWNQNWIQYYLSQEAKVDEGRKNFCGLSTLDSCSDIELCERAVLSQRLIKSETLKNKWAEALESRRGTCLELADLKKRQLAAKAAKDREELNKKPHYYWDKAIPTVADRLENPPEFSGVYLRMGHDISQLEPLKTSRVGINSAYVARSKFERFWSEFGVMWLDGITLEQYQSSVHLGRRNLNSGITIPKKDVISIITVGRSGFGINRVEFLGSTYELAQSVKRPHEVTGMGRNGRARKIEYSGGVVTPFVDSEWGYDANQILKARFLNDTVTEYLFKDYEPCHTNTIKDVNTEEWLPSYGTILHTTDGERYLFSCLKNSLGPWKRPSNMSAAEARKIFDSLKSPF